MNLKELDNESLLGIYLFLTMVSLKDLSEEFFLAFLREVTSRPAIDLDVKFKSLPKTRKKNSTEYQRLSDFLFKAYKFQRDLDDFKKTTDNELDFGSLYTFLFSRKLSRD